MDKIYKIFLFLIASIFTGYAHATMYDITGVLSGTDGGFAFSGFHDASNIDGDNNPMTGPGLTTIDTFGFSGTYDDVSGSFSATFSIADAAGPVSMSGTLLFDGSGLLSANSELVLDFTGSNGVLDDTTIGLLPGDVCCSGSHDPNAFNGSLMSLWGANFDYGGPGFGPFNGSYANSTLGMDLRIQLTAVPVPASVWLLGSGLLGLVSVARRKRVS